MDCIPIIITNTTNITTRVNTEEKVEEAIPAILKGEIGHAENISKHESSIIRERGDINSTYTKR